MNGAHSKSLPSRHQSNRDTHSRMGQQSSWLPSTAVAAWAGFASFIAIFALSVCDTLVHIEGVTAVTVIGSFGATAVLVYGAPHAEFSRFRNVVYGHGLSAFIGVSTGLLVGVEMPTAAATAVGLAVFSMHLTDTTHPPGGATALIAVTGGDRVYQLGYLYVFVPVLAGALLMYALGWFGRATLRPRTTLAEEPVDET